MLHVLAFISRLVKESLPNSHMMFFLPTARKSLISTGREPLVCTSFPTGTAPPVLTARALSTGQLARY